VSTGMRANMLYLKHDADVGPEDHAVERWPATEAITEEAAGKLATHLCHSKERGPAVCG
jgi:hypothetical protein